MSDDTTGRDSPKFMLRLPGDMRERIAAEAKANKRSMNAEIVARLQASLDTCAEQSDSGIWANPPTFDNSIYVLLDTDGMPTSWDEILTHMHYINKNFGRRYTTQNAFVLTPQMLSTESRKIKDLNLIENYMELMREQTKRAARAAKSDPLSSDDPADNGTDD